MKPVGAASTDFVQVPRQIFAVGFGQRAHQRGFAPLRSLTHRRRELRELVGAWEDLDRRVHDAARSDHHVDHPVRAPLVLHVPRRSRH